MFVSFASRNSDSILWDEICVVRISGGLGLVGSWIGHKYCFKLPLLVPTIRKPNSSARSKLVGT